MKKRGNSMYICTQHGGEQECPKGLAPACCYEACEELCWASCLRFDQGEGCPWRKAICQEVA